MWKQLWLHDRSQTRKSIRQKRPAYSSAQKDSLVTQDLPLHLAFTHPFFLRSDRRERRTRQCCPLYHGDICWCFGQCQCLHEEIRLEFNRIQKRVQRVFSTLTTWFIFHASLFSAFSLVYNTILGVITSNPIVLFRLRLNWCELHICWVSSLKALYVTLFVPEF